MSYVSLYTTRNRSFGEYSKGFDEADYIILGVPLDATSTYRSGSRFAPMTIREASQNLESYSLRIGGDIENMKVSDIGDLNLYGTVEETLHHLQLVLGEIVAAKKTPIVLGGEHTITYGCVKPHGDVAVLSFDAHMDLRDEYLGKRLSHATFMRRLGESLGSGKIMEIGVRAICNEELEFAHKGQIKYVTSLEAIKNDCKTVAKRIDDFLSGFRSFYLTLDMDVLDPAYAPAVANPAPEGLSPTILLDLLKSAFEHNLLGFDLVEVSPHYDSGTTALQAAYIIYNILAFLDSKKT